MVKNSNINFYLDGIFNSSYSYPSQVKICSPVWDVTYNYSGNSVLCGLLTSEPTFSSQNKWGPVLSDTSILSDVSSLIGNKEIFTWIGASVQCWKSTDPLRFSLTMYLINYRRGLHLEEKLSDLVKLTALGRSHGRGATKDWTVVTHGGYEAEVLRGNQDQFDRILSTKDKDDAKKSAAYGLIHGTAEKMGEDWVQTGNSYDSAGTVSVKIGNSKIISNLLVSRIDVTPSLLEVYDENKPKPLYYKVSVGFTGARPLLTTDVNRMFF